MRGPMVENFSAFGVSPQPVALIFLELVPATRTAEFRLVASVRRYEEEFSRRKITYFRIGTMLINKMLPRQTPLFENCKHFSKVRNHVLQRHVKYVQFRYEDIAPICPAISLIA